MFTLSPATPPLELDPAAKERLRAGGKLDQLHALMRLLAEKRGQDLHLSAGAPPSFRLDGELVRLPLPVMTPDDLQALLVELLTPEQKASFVRDLELDFAVAVDGAGRFRCNVYRQRHSLAFTARHVRDVVPSMDELRLPSFLREIAKRTGGLVLITGPNGHGKSTTLAWLVEAINKERAANIITIEDPIEFHFAHARSNVNQREVGSDTRSFAEGLHRVVRQNPDVIVIGELRDHESVATALTAAETGHLVLATMHAASATAVLDRVLDFFQGNEQAQVRAQMSETLILSLSQRLVKRAHGGGRVLAWEAVRQSQRVKNALREGRAHVLRSLMQGNHDDLIPLEHSLAELVASNTITREEAQRWSDQLDYLDDLIRARRELLHAPVTRRLS